MSDGIFIFYPFYFKTRNARAEFCKAARITSRQGPLGKAAVSPQ